MALYRPAAQNHRLSLIAELLIALLPTTPFIGLPIGYVESPPLAVGPGLTRCGKSIHVIAVEQENDAVIGIGVCRQRSIVDQKSHIGLIRIAVLDDEDNRVILSVADTPGRVRQERVLTIGPQMSVQRLGALFRRRLYDDPPAALDGLFQQRRQHVLHRDVLQMIE